MGAAWAGVHSESRLRLAATFRFSAAKRQEGFFVLPPASWVAE